MERGYLIAALALSLTFAGVSRGFRSLEQISLLRFQHFGAAMRSQCPAKHAADLAAKLKAHMPRTPEDAQVLAESVPIAAVPISRYDAAISRSAREKAMREAERANRELMRAQRAVERYQYSYSYGQPMAIHVDLSPEINARVQVAAAKLAASTAAMQAAQFRFTDRAVHVSVPRLSCPNAPLPPAPPAVLDDDSDSN
jgi:hypothetical protein